MREIDRVTGVIVDAAIYVHRRLGPGLLESVYEEVLAGVLLSRGLCVVRQLPVHVEIDGNVHKKAFIIDLLVNESVVVELKSSEKLPAVSAMQLLTYLRLTHLEVGLLINFGLPTLIAGLKRIVNDYREDNSPAS